MRHAQSRDRWSVASIGPPKGHVIHAQPAVIVWEMDSDLHGVFHLFSSTPSGSRIVNLLTIRLFACQSNRGHSLHFGGRDGSALIGKKKWNKMWSFFLLSSTAASEDPAASRKRRPWDLAESWQNIHTARKSYKRLAVIGSRRLDLIGCSSCGTSTCQDYVSIGTIDCK